MKNNKGIVRKRQQRILQYLKNEHTVHVNKLAYELAVTPITIRRDLQMFEEQGLVTRFHGGATIIENALREDSSLAEDEAQMVTQCKEAIAKHAASLVENGDTIFMNSSTTALLILKYIGNKRVSVITNNGRALHVDRSPSIELILTGGEVHQRKLSMVGELALQSLTRIVASKSFIGVSGISAVQGITTSVLQETAVNELMMKRCGGNCYIVADSSKIGKQNNFFSAPIQLAKTLITDCDADPRELSDIRSCGVDVVMIEKNQ